MASILIVGRLPPPIGGITVHVSRLIENLKRIGFKDFEFADLNAGLANVAFKLLQSRAIHLHLSNPYWQLCIALLCKLSFKKLIITYHGDWGRYSLVGNFAVSLSCRLAHTPVVQNDESFRKAFQYNRNVKLISTYLTSEYIAALEPNTESQLLNFTKNYKRIICTSAWNVTFDKYGKEIYGISELVEWIARNRNYALIISDPSGNYRSFINKKHFPVPDNVMFLTNPHDFRNVLKVSDVFIRNTTTDGISLSICEALDLKVLVLASDSVSRPLNCIVFKDLWEVDLESVIAASKNLSAGEQPEPGSVEVIQRLISVYRDT